MSSVTLNKAASEEWRHIKNVEPATGLMRIPQTNEQHIRPLDLVGDGAFNGGIRAFYRQLGSFKSQDGKQLRTLGLTSCYQDEGKSTVGGYLASIAAESRRVLFIDANGSRLAINKTMQDVALSGISLANGDPLSSQANGQPALDETRDLLRVLSRSFELIVVDLPPLDSASVLDWAPLLDGVVLVVESERVRWQVAARGIELLEQAGSQVLGTVINKQREYIPQWLYQKL
jgi:Mrp family chromosome partitioning ATPase